MASGARLPVFAILTLMCCSYADSAVVVDNDVRNRGACQIINDVVYDHGQQRPLTSDDRAKLADYGRQVEAYWEAFRENMNRMFSGPQAQLPTYPSFPCICSPLGNECPDGWSRYSRTKSCFLVSEERQRWSEAERDCQRLGGHLASLVDEYETYFVFDLAKSANLSVQTVWLGRITRLARSGAYEWHDGAVGRYRGGFRVPPSGEDICMTIRLDFDHVEGSWNEWDCNYAGGYPAVCKKPYRRQFDNDNETAVVTPPPTTHSAKRCCASTPCPHRRCAPNERCIPDDLDCLTKTCKDSGIGWCLPTK
ncbi:Lectin C-type domain containing protein [Aphelenchoides avenae]|nr:Lectin C-type domain containing protein [Aphelenchus avenae]